MIQFENNFTTPEQSKRLLKLGVPADSSDMNYHSAGNKFTIEHLYLNKGRKYSDLATNFENLTLPCWSVGRLIEIAEIMVGSTTWQDYQQPSVEKPTLVERAVCTIENLCNLIKFDFEKLF